jgi:N-hydroxyarylamine O-acetyltransferase
MQNSLFSLDAYFNRIDFQGEAKPSLATVTELMRRQLVTVPFENIDIQAGKIISLDPNDIVEKIIHRQRGGYCYEVNGLFAMALSALGIPYFFIAARPISHGGRKPKTHMALVLKLQGEKWLCDLGFGGYGIRAPMRINVLESAVNQDGELFMLSLQQENELVLKMHNNNGWEDLYAFELTAQNWADFAPANYFNSTHPDSIFTRKLLVAICTATGRKIVFGHSFKKIENGQIEKQLLSAENRTQILREEFGLVP